MSGFYTLRAPAASLNAYTKAQLNKLVLPLKHTHTQISFILLMHILELVLLYLLEYLTHHSGIQKRSLYL